ncbi:MAG: hypothetical protein Kow0042_06340 [Calditrichia bacterium]
MVHKLEPTSNQWAREFGRTKSGAANRGQNRPHLESGASTANPEPGNIRGSSQTRDQVSTVRFRQTLA